MILADTNVITQLTRADCDPAVLDWIEASERSLWISNVTIGEMAFGVARLPAGQKKDALSRKLAMLLDRFADRQAPYVAAEALVYGDLMARARARGTPMSAPDGMIAAVALARGFALATRNIRDFRIDGLVLVDPWSPMG